MTALQALRDRPALVFQFSVALLALPLLPALMEQTPPESRALAGTLAAAAVLFDLTASALGVAWWHRRRAGLGGVRAAGVLLCGLLLAGLTLPDPGVRLGALALVEPLALGLALWLTWRTLRGVRAAASSASPLEVLRSELGQILPRPLARGLAHEALLWSCLRRGEAFVPTGAEALTSFRRSGRVAYVWLYVCSELPLHLGLHAALAPSGGAALAWLLTAADLSFTAYLFALARSHERFPSYVQGGQLQLQQGLLWSARFPLSEVLEVTAGADGAARRLTLITPPNLTLRLAGPVELHGPWGLRRRAERLSLFLDDPAQLRKLIGQRP